MGFGPLLPILSIIGWTNESVRSCLLVELSYQRWSDLRSDRRNISSSSHSRNFAVALGDVAGRPTLSSHCAVSRSNMPRVDAFLFDRQSAIGTHLLKTKGRCFHAFLS